MKLTRSGVALATLLAAAALPSGLVAQGPDLASVAVYSGGVDFLPNVDYRGAVLTVSGNGQTYRYELDSRQAPSIGVFTPGGRLLADGTYRWELELRPSEATARELRAEGAEPWRVQSGAFTIRAGIIADPAAVELREPPRRGTGQGLTFTSGLQGTRRAATEDIDAAVGSRAGVEARVNADAARAQAPASGAFQQADPGGGDDSDATTTALGRSLEPSNQLPAPSRRAIAPRPRSDGSNGRPRS